MYNRRFRFFFIFQLKPQQKTTWEWFPGDLLGFGGVSNQLSFDELHRLLSFLLERFGFKLEYRFCVTMKKDWKIKTEKYSPNESLLETLYWFLSRMLNECLECGLIFEMHFLRHPTDRFSSIFHHGWLYFQPHALCRGFTGRKKCLEIPPNS